MTGPMCSGSEPRRCSSRCPCGRSTSAACGAAAHVSNPAPRTRLQARRCACQYVPWGARPGRARGALCPHPVAQSPRRLSCQLCWADAVARARHEQHLMEWERIKRAEEQIPAPPV
jgi:hypothetical protein